MANERFEYKTAKPIYQYGIVGAEKDMGETDNLDEAIKCVEEEADGVEDRSPWAREMYIVVSNDGGEWFEVLRVYDLPSRSWNREE